MLISDKSKSEKKSPSPESGMEVEDKHIGTPSREAFFELFKHIWRYKLYFWSGIVFALTATLSTLIEPWLLGVAVDEAITPGNLSKLKETAFLLALVEFVRVASLIGEGYVFAVLGQYVMQDLRVQLFARLLKIPVSQFDRVPVGRLVTRVTNDVSSLADMFSSGFVTIIGNVLVAFGILVSLLFINFKLGLITAAMFPFLVMLSSNFSGRLKQAYTNTRARLSAVNAFLAENIQGMRTLHALNGQSRHLNKFTELNKNFAEAQFGSVRVFALFQPTITMFTGVSMALLIWIGGGMAAQQEIKVGILVSFIAYVTTLFQPVREVADKWNVILSGMTSAERVFALLKWPLERGASHQTQEAQTEPIDIQGEIRFENVWFAYKDEDWVLRDFNLSLEPGERVGIVGPTGSGKTTLISLLMRFYEPQKGRILIDGKDIRDYDLKSLRATIGFVQQDVFLFSGTMKENITLWRDSAHDPALLPRVAESWEESLHEGGTNVSRGERQVISFCRALFKRPKLWILDEATANIDSESEKSLENLLHQHSEGRTTFVIAHRLSTVRDMDRIIVLNKGSLLEQGRHEDLLRQGGLYAKLYKYQTVSAATEESAHDHQLERQS